MSRPLIALTVGDPAGIGPEIVCAALADERVRRATDLLVLGPGALRPADVPPLRSTSPLELVHVEGSAWFDTLGPVRFELGRPQAECGRAALRALHEGARLAQEGLVDALVTGPTSKEALHLAGERVEGQTELLGRWARAAGEAGAEEVEMMAVAGSLRVLLYTRHMPLAEALRRLRAGKLVRHLRLLHETLRGFGFDSPRLALAGLNPHAGENGLLGTEEREILAPAADTARAEGLDVTGPLSPDSVFARARDGEFDGVLALYHDQAFIPIKLIGGERGLTVLAGLPYLRISPTHGTAFDIAGRGIASAENLVAALLQAAEWAPTRRAAEPVHVGV